MRQTRSDLDEHGEERPIASTRRVVFIFCFFVAGLVSYSNVINSFFLSDDFVMIGKALECDFSLTWGIDQGGFFRPVSLMSYFVDARLWGRSPLGFHLTNTLLHAVNAFLVSCLALQLTRLAAISRLRREALSLVAGLIFLLHPSHTEAVSWISGRADLLATLFSLLSLVYFVAPERQWQRWPWSRLLICLCSFALALLAKESAASLPLAVFLIGTMANEKEGKNSLKQSAKDAVPFVIILAVYIVVRTFILGTVVGGYGAGQHLNFSHSMIVSQLLRFPLRALLPALVLRSFPFLESHALSLTLIGVGEGLVIVTVFALTQVRARKALLELVRLNKLLWLVLALFLCMLLPVINLRIDVFSTQGERFLYLPSVFSSMALGYVLSKLVRGPARSWFAVVFVLVALYSVSLWKTNQRWAETARLSRSILEDLANSSVDGPVLLLNLPDNLDGMYLYRNGMPEALRTFLNGKSIGQTKILAWHGLRSAQDEVELVEATGIFSLRLLEGKTEFERVSAPEIIELLERTPNLLRFRIIERAVPGEIFYFSAGHMRKVEYGSSTGTGSF